MAYERGCKFFSCFSVGRAYCLSQHKVFKMIFDWFREKISEIQNRSRIARQNQKKAEQIERGEYRDENTFGNTKFNGDYDLSCRMLRRQLNERFPDNYHARSLAGYNPKRDYTAEHSDAIDVSSTAIARALRAGAGIDQAVKSGAQSIGL